MLLEEGELVATFVFLASAWGPVKGGVNSFNHSLCTALAKKPSSSDKVICMAEASQPDIDTAEKENVTLIPLAVAHMNEDPSRLISYIKDLKESENIIWIGHDIYTGNIANTCAQHNGGQSVVIHHVDFDAYYLYKNMDNEEKTKKSELQKSILNGANVVFAVGPTLFESARKKVTKKNKVFAFLPGLVNITAAKVEKEDRVLMFGRADDNSVKQANLSAIAASKAFDSLPNPHDWRILLAGYEDKESVKYKEVEKEVEDNGGRPGCLEFSDYTVDRNRVFEQIKRAKICLMPSKYEGFGLSGFEAIAAGTPLIITKNSGLYKYLEIEGLSGYVSGVDIKGTNIEGKSNKDDIDALSLKIIEIASDYNSKLAGIEKLKEELQNRKCSWENTALTFLTKLSEAAKIETDQLNKAKKPQKRTVNFLIEVDNQWCDFFSSHLLPMFATQLLPKETAQKRRDSIRCIIVRFEGARRYSWFDDKQKSNSRKKLRPKNAGVVGMMLASQKTILHDFCREKSYKYEWPNLVEYNVRMNPGKPEGCVVIIASPIIVDDQIVGAITFDIANCQEKNEVDETDELPATKYPALLKPLASDIVKNREREMKRLVEVAEKLAATVADYFKFCKHDFK